MRSDESSLANTVLQAGRVGPAVQRVAIPPASSEGDVRVELERSSDGVIRRILIHCDCGRCIPLTCDYASGTEETAP